MKLKHFLYLLPLLAVLGLIQSAHTHAADPAGADTNVDYYTCGMHPSVRSHDPNGHCPICHMSLEPVYKRAAGAGTNTTAHDTAMTLETESNEVPSEFTVPMSRQQFIGVTYAT